MSIKDRLATDMRGALKSGDRTRLGVLRMLRSKMQEAEVSLRASEGADYSLEDEPATEAIASYAKQRRESIESYEKAGREDLASRERAELEIIQEYLPEQLGEDEIKEIVRQAIAESGAASIKDLGKVMKLVIPHTKGRADGKRVNALVRQALGG